MCLISLHAGVNLFIIIMHAWIDHHDAYKDSPSVVAIFLALDTYANGFSFGSTLNSLTSSFNDINFPLVLPVKKFKS